MRILNRTCDYFMKLRIVFFRRKVGTSKTNFCDCRNIISQRFAESHARRKAERLTLRQVSRPDATHVASHWMKNLDHNSSQAVLRTFFVTGIEVPAYVRVHVCTGTSGDCSRI